MLLASRTDPEHGLGTPFRDGLGRMRVFWDLGSRRTSPSRRGG